MAAEVIPQFAFDTPEQDANLVSAVLRRNFNAVGTNNYTTDANYPENPRNGMFRILDESGAGTNIRLQWYYEGSWYTLINHMELLLPFAKRSEFPFIAQQIWVIDHGFGSKPIVQCFDSATNLDITPASIEHALVAGEWSRVIVTHNNPETGYAVLVG
jgi:hypothetical protein